MNILVIEDERLAVEKLLQVLRKVRPTAQVIGVADSIAAAVAWLTANPGKPDLILMDIELADGQSFAIFDQVAVESPIIFVTSYDEYALKAFKVNSIDYLLKPIQQDDLKLALEKFDRTQAIFKDNGRQQADIQKLIQELQKGTDATAYRKRFLVKHLQKLMPIEVANISYFFYEDRVTFFRTPDGVNYIVDYPVDEIETMLDPNMFFRINRGMLVAIHSIHQINPYFGNRLEIKLKPQYDKEVIVSREKVSNFKVWLGK
ncbi:LytR/AlgR family response regulator transcription factor [Parapedobacter koreensis]|uniref:Two component transcriptional regulator, LytTR family n=1 Tax=Parapedobacter koreensis TaxID=332977 RepID=A0A1H7TKW6_9SPHI|nr:LytTR family DNA-binding domain-containing protein [Parapedobacter koreensis]SEL85119.1 two component transcriptional regulator, LytTR family [Parapedobacter koreensis]